MSNIQATDFSAYSLVSLYESRRDADYPEVLRRFSQSTQANVRTVP